MTSNFIESVNNLEECTDLNWAMLHEQISFCFFLQRIENIETRKCLTWKSWIGPYCCWDFFHNLSKADWTNKMTWLHSSANLLWVKWTWKFQCDFFFWIIKNRNLWQGLSWNLSWRLWSSFTFNLLITSNGDTLVVAIWLFHYFIKEVLFCKSIDRNLEIDCVFFEIVNVLKSILHIIYHIS